MRDYLDDIYGHRGYRVDPITDWSETMGFDHRYGGATFAGRGRMMIDSPRGPRLLEAPIDTVGRSRGSHALTARNLAAVPDGSFAELSGNNRKKAERREWGAWIERQNRHEDRELQDWQERQDRRRERQEAVGHYEQPRRHTTTYVGNLVQSRSRRGSRGGCGGIWDIFKR